MLSADNKAPSGERYFLAHVTPGLHCSIQQELPALNWSSLSVGDTLTISASTTYRADVPGSRPHPFLAQLLRFLRPELPADGRDPRRRTGRVETQDMELRHHPNDAQPRHRQKLGRGRDRRRNRLEKRHKDANQQVAFDDVTVTHTPAPKLASTSSGGTDFNRDIRPILSENCFLCHGQDPEHRGGDLRLDIREEAVAVRDGIAAIVPGDPKNSDIIKRIISKDPDMVMPPPKAHIPAMKPEQLALLEKWIENGAEYQPHWSFVDPKKKETPTANPVDHFINKRLQEKNLTAAPVADDNTLVRRIHLDLTGLPATQDINAYLDDKSSDRWEKLIDRLMSSTQFAERMAMPWLDGALLRHTRLLHRRPPRHVGLARLGDQRLPNQPYDQFVTEQIAGDLIPNATPG